MAKQKLEKINNKGKGIWWKDGVVTRRIPDTFIKEDPQCLGGEEKRLWKLRAVFATSEGLL